MTFHHCIQTISKMTQGKEKEEKHMFDEFPLLLFKKYLENARGEQTKTCFDDFPSFVLKRQEKTALDSVHVNKKLVTCNEPRGSGGRGHI